MIGGQQLNDNCEIKGELYDAATGVRTSLPRMTTRRCHYPGTVATQEGTSGRIYVFGGHDGIHALRSCEFLDVGQEQWVLVDAEMITRRALTCATLLDHNTAVICGGRDGGHEMTSCEKFDLITRTFSPFPDMLEPRSVHAVVNYNGNIVAIGGGRAMNTCEQFDIHVWKWIPFASINTLRAGFAAAVIENKIYLAGCGSSVEVYDGSAWSFVTHLPVRRYNAYTVALRGKLAAIGGASDITDEDGGTDLFDPATCDISSLPHMIQPKRRSFAAVSF